MKKIYRNMNPNNAYFADAIRFHFKNFEYSPALATHALTRLQFIAYKYALDKSKLRAELWFQVDPYEHKVSMRMKLPTRYVHLAAASEDMYESVNLLMDKLDVLVRKVKGKTNQKRKRLTKKNGLHNILQQQSVA